MADADSRQVFISNDWRYAVNITIMNG
jgi:hypothetical protein